MTPKEKAKYLFDMFYNISGNHPAAKKSCRICVDEITKVIDAIHLRFMNDRPDLYYDSDTIDQFHYWQEVKQEIEIL